MAKRKVLPYHATQAIDAAKMDISDLLREARVLNNGPVAIEERYMRLGRIIDLAHRAEKSLDEVRTQ